ncbi:ExbD/TolR family protein [Lignipirellula cremea]|uniref:Biopolymer transport protein ExbD/TolR n=1 Tax=Lignipirellula cremea TaxID=2528010 RepID=A0A518DST7_9BACT|nr:biopolymer transporter ExbD [Lignipirellula cremea]QDU94894.1 Biopolymer transport protein ExbD/TolR [Lignipirellula cremea]
MHLSKHKRQMNAKMNMTPMIDIVFLLIIFFMTVTQVSKVNSEKLDLPQQKGFDQQESDVIINIMQNGEIIIFGQPQSPLGLVEALEKEVQRQGGNPDRVKVTVRNDQAGTAGTFNEVCSLLNKLGLKRVTIATQNPG